MIRIKSALAIFYPVLLVLLSCEGKLDMGVTVGERAPSFQLKDEDGVEHKLDDYLGKKIVLFFYPKDDSPHCRREACNLRDNYEKMQQQGIVLLGISYDSPESHKKFREKYDLPFTLLSDGDRQMAKRYGASGGILGFLGARRYTYLINEQGIIVHIFKKVNVDVHAGEVLEAFQRIEKSK
jgi:peroxiredoxin Q/BCP